MTNICAYEEGCSLPSSSNELEIIVRQLKREVSELIQTTTDKFLKQDGKIAEMCVYIKENLSNELRILLDSMVSSSEINDIITSVLSNELELIQYKTQDYTTPKMYGAVGNGINNDTEAFQKAINSKKEIFVGEGVYLVDTLNILDNTKIIFSNKAILKLNKGKSRLFNCSDRTNIQIIGGTFEGDNKTLTQELFVLNNVSNSLLENIKITNVLNKGIVLNGNSENNILNNIDVSGCISETGAGISLHGSNVINNKLTNITANKNRIGITLNNASYNQLMNITCNDNTDMGFTIDGIETNTGGLSNVIINITCNNNGKVGSNYGGIYIGNASSYNNFKNAVCNNNANTGIKLLSATTLSNNIIDGFIVEGNKNGIEIALSPKTTITNGIVRNNTSRGIYTNQSNHSTFTNLKVENNGEGVLSQSAYNIVTNCEFMNNQTFGLRIATGGSVLTATSSVVSNCMFGGNATNYVLSDNSVLNNSVIVA